jgi:predicted nucleotidyltransferase
MATTRIAQTLAEKRTEYVQALEENLPSLVQQLAAMPAVHRVILIGSYAQGRRDLFTDLDLVVVIDSTQDFVMRNANLIQQLHFTVALDLLAYTPEEFTRMVERPFLRHALKTAQVLYAKPASE